MPSLKYLLEKKAIRNLLILIFIFCHIFIFYKIKLLDLLSGQTPMLDFDAYWHLARAILAGQHPYQVSTMQTAGPPLVILPFLPFGLLSIEWGRSIITIINLITASLSCYLISSKIYTKYKILYTLFFSTLLNLSFPARFSISLGQPNLIILFLITLALTIQSNKIKGLSLALLIILKSFFLFTIPALITQNKKIITWSLVFGSLIFVLSLQLIKPVFYLDFINQRLGSTMLQAQQIKDVDYYNQSINTTMARFNLGDYYSVTYLAIIVIVTLYLIKSGNIEAGIIISVLLSPLVWQHYFAYLFPIFILLGSQLIKKKKWGKVILLLLALSLWLPEFSWLQNQPTTLFNSLVASHYLISALILLGLITTNVTLKQGDRV